MSKTSKHFDDEDEKPFGVQDALPGCPRCNKLMGPGDTVCKNCGHDLKGKPTTFEPVTKHWEAGLPLSTRLRILAICLAVSFLSLVFALFLGEWVGALISWLLFTGLVTFLLGTYDCVDLTRSERGKIVLTKTWRVCFFACEPVKLRLSDHEGVSTGEDRDADMWDWAVLLILLLYGLIPGIVWWYFVFHCDRYFVALTADHGAPKTYLYRGTKEENMKEIAQTLREVAFPEYVHPELR